MIMVAKTRKEALTLGMTVYKTNIPCKNGHISFRYVSNLTCIICAKEKSNNWRNKNRDDYNQYHSKWHKNNRIKEQIKLATPKWFNEENINKVYEEAEKQSKIWNMELVVIHEIPLIHRRICGLHVSNNLQIVSKSYEKRKGNRLFAKKEEKRLIQLNNRF
jgi:hypothetical protein